MSALRAKGATKRRSSMAEMDKIEGLARIIAARRAGQEESDPFGLALSKEQWELARVEAEAVIGGYERLRPEERDKAARAVHGAPNYRLEVNHAVFQGDAVLSLVNTFNLAMQGADVMQIYRAAALWLVTLAIRGETEAPPDRRMPRRQMIDGLHELLELAVNRTELHLIH